MKILVVEDDVQLSIAISEFFKTKEAEVVAVKDGISAIDHIDTNYFDLYIIDISIPDIDGLELLKYIRKTDINTPIIIITASSEIEKLFTAFDYGCSEYIKKPFHLKELELRTNNLMHSDKPNNIHLRKELYYNLQTEICYYKGKPIKLRHKEKRFCTLLVKNINNIVPTGTVYDYVWEGVVKESYPIRQLLVELRKKLPYTLIETKLREGYIIESER